MLIVDLLEDRIVPAPYYLSISDPSTSDGSLRVGVDGYGAFGSGVGTNSGNADFDPFGRGRANTVNASALALRVNGIGAPSFLASGLIQGSGGLPNVDPTGDSTNATSSFIDPSSQLRFDLLQSLGRMENSVVFGAPILRQTYTITNLTGGTVNFELFRYLDGDLPWVRGSSEDSGGRLVGPLETLFVTDDNVRNSTGDPNWSTSFVGVTAVGGTIPGSNHWQVDQPGTLRNRILTAPFTLQNSVFAPGSLGFVNYNSRCCWTNGYDIAVALRNTFSLTGLGASITYTTTTVFGGIGRPADVQTPAVLLIPTGTNAVTEGGPSDTYSMVLTKAPTADVTVNLNTGIYLNVAPTAYTFTPLNWNTPQTATFTAVDNGTYEGTRTSTITHTASSADTGFNSASGFQIPNLRATITDNEPPPDGVTFAETGGSTDVAEAGGSDTYTLVLNTMPAANVIVSLTPDTRLNAFPTALTFTAANWNTPQTVNVAAIDDTLVQNAVTPFNYPGLITHAATSVDPIYNGIAIADLNATITDNDLPPGVAITPGGGSLDVTEGGATDTLTVRLDAAPTANVVVTLAPDSFLTVSQAVLTFTTLNWSTMQNVTVTAVNDAAIQNAVAPYDYAGTITLTATSLDVNYNNIAIPAVTATITDNDIPGVAIAPISLSVIEGTSQPYTVRLNTLPSGNVVVTLAPGAPVTIGAATLTFTTANWNVAQTVTVTVPDDSVAQGTRTATITHSASSGDANYNGVAVPSVTVDIVDNDSVGLILLESGGSTDLAEGGAPTGPLTDTYTITLASQPTASVAVTLAGDANVGAVPAALTFTPANWNTVRTITVTAVDDNKVEGLHTGIITHTVTSADPNYAALTLPAVTANITDNESLTIPVTPAGSNLALLEGTSTTYSMALVAAPTADVTISIAPGPLATATPASLTFTASNWFIPQKVTVAAVDDSVIQGLHTETIAQTVSSADPKYSGLSMASITVAIVDNDASFVTGTAGNDQILVAPSSRDPSQILVTVNGKTTSIPVSVGQLRIQAGGGSDTIQITTPPIPITVDGESGTDKLFVNGQAVAGNAFGLGLAAVTVNGVEVSLWGLENVTVAGKSKNDVLTIQNLPSFAVEFKGDVGTDQVIGPALGGTFAITAAGAGTVNGTFKFTTVESLTGGTGNDTFTFSPGKKMAGRIDGGSGNDTLDYSVYTSAVTANLQTGVATDIGGFANIETIKGGKGTDKLIGRNEAAQWNVIGTNAGSYSSASLLSLVFTGIENLTAGTGDDTFRFADGASVKGKIDTGAGTDTVDYSAYTLAVTVNLQAKTGTGTSGLLGLETIFAGSSGADTLVAGNRANAWNVRDQGAGTINAQVNFTSFENLTGGSMSDIFNLDILGGWAGLVDGAAGNDELIAFPNPGNNWTYTSSTAGSFNGMRFVRVEKHH